MKEYPGQAPLLWPLLERIEVLEGQLAMMTDRCNQLIGYCNQLGSYLGVAPFDANVVNGISQVMQSTGGTVVADSNIKFRPVETPSSKPDPEGPQAVAQSLAVVRMYADDVQWDGEDNSETRKYFFYEDCLSEIQDIFELELNGNQGQFSVSSNPQVQNDIIFSINKLEKVVDIEGPEPMDYNCQVETLEMGELEKNDYMWVVKKRAKVTFKPKQENQ